MRSKANPESLCQHYTAAGRRCRMLLAPNHPRLCTFHASVEATAAAEARIAEAKAQRAQSIESVAADLLSGTGNLSEPVAVKREGLLGLTSRVDWQG